MKVNTILFPASFFDGKKVDEDIQNEYEVALDIEHFAFCPKWKSVAVGDEVSVFSFHFQIFF